MASFLSNGDRVLAYHIPHILQQLYALASIIFSLNRYRFYAASLLFIYDGDAEVQKAYQEHAKKARSANGGNSRDASSLSSHRPSSRKKIKYAPGAVTIRLIDFAHCTTGDDFVGPDAAAEFGLSPGDPTPDGRAIARFPPTHPNQPDLGFLLGLKSLCTALRMIWTEEGGGELHVEGEQVWTEIWGSEGGEDQGLGRGVTPETAYELATA